MDQVVLTVRLERIRVREVKENVEDFLEIPRSRHSNPVRAHNGLRRERADVRLQRADQTVRAPAEQQLEAVYHQVLLRADVDGRAPSIPSAVVEPRVQLGAHESDDYVLRIFAHFYPIFYIKRDSTHSGPDPRTDLNLLRKKDLRSI